MNAAAGSRLRAAALPGLTALKRNWPPILALQIGAALIVAAYYAFPSMQEGLRHLGDFKTRGGLVFAFCSGFLGGSVIPELAKLLTGRLKKVDQEWLKATAFNGLVYGVVAIEVDVFYHFQTLWFGSGRDPMTLLIKTAVDMGPFSTLLSIPSATAFFEWRAGGCARVKRLLTWDGYVERVAPSQILCWGFWIPVLFAVYAMPADLQFCLSQLAEAAWSILFIFIATDQHTA